MAKTFKFAIGKLKNCKLLLILTVILTALTSMCFGSTIILKGYDAVELSLRNLIEHNGKYTFLTFSSPTNKTLVTYEPASLDENALQKINEYAGGNMTECYKYPFIDAVNFNGTKGPGYTQTLNYFTDYVMKVSRETGEERAQIHRCERLAKETSCTLPSNSNEIAISSLMAYSMVIYGAVTEKATDGSNAMTIVKPKSIDELIGMKLFNGLTITGIYSSNDGMSEYFEPYITTGIEENSKDYLKNYYLHLGTSPSCFAYVNEDFIKLHAPKTPKYVFAKLKGNYNSDLNFLKSFTGEEGERLMPCNIYTGYTAYFTNAAINIKYHPQLESDFWLHFWAYALPTAILSFVTTILYFYLIYRQKNESGINEVVSNSTQCLSVLLQASFMAVISWAFALIGIQIILMNFNGAYGASMFASTPAIDLAMLGMSFLLTVLLAFTGLGFTKLIKSKKKEG